MGAAIGVFEGARALCVPRSRFVPVKTTDDLLALRSDVYRLRDDGRVEPVAEPPYIALDPAYFKRVDDFEARFPHGAPSLRQCRRFVVRGDVTFGARCRGPRPRRGLRRRPGRHGAGGGVPSSRGDADVSTGQPREDAKIAFDKERRRRALSRLGVAACASRPTTSRTCCPSKRSWPRSGATSRASIGRAGDPARRDRRHRRPPPRRVRPRLPPLPEHPRALGADRRGAQARRGDAADRRLPDRRPATSSRTATTASRSRVRWATRTSTPTSPRSAPSSAPAASCR